MQLQLSLRRVSLVFNATEWSETPWTQLHLSMTQPSATRATHACTITQSGERVAPVATDNRTYAFPHAVGRETEVVLSC